MFFQQSASKKAMIPTKPPTTTTHQQNIASGQTMYSKGKNISSSKLLFEHIRSKSKQKNDMRQN